MRQRYDNRPRNKNGTLMTANDRKRLNKNLWYTIDKNGKTIEGSSFDTLSLFKVFCTHNKLIPIFRA